MESCEICGFAWDAVPTGDVATRVADGAEEVAALLADPHAGQRPSVGRWSGLEYACHVRDVLLHVRDRLVIGLVEDDPTFKPLYRDERVDLGLYHDDTAEVVATEVRVAAALFARTFDRLSVEQLRRPVQYAYPAPATRTLLWMGQQVVHEVEHHLADMRDNARRAG
ncbi:MAG: DinB family protein [Ilumatobacteraceae bacterium]|nr:DinB family protein [Ilumatobacteraceae bacterium]